jgi:hypothetical protein
MTHMNLDNENPASAATPAGHISNSTIGTADTFENNVADVADQEKVPGDASRKAKKSKTFKPRKIWEIPRGYIAKHWHGKRNGNWINIQSPNGHTGRTLGVLIDRGVPGGFRVSPAPGDDRDACIAHVKQKILSLLDEMTDEKLQEAKERDTADAAEAEKLTEKKLKNCCIVWEGAVTDDEDVVGYLGTWTAVLSGVRPRH